jgi:hypothetical protein
VACHLSVVVGLILIGVRHFRDAHAGVSAATLYLLLPYSFLLLPFTPLHVGQWYQVWPASLIIGAFLAYRRPAIAGFLLGIAAGTVYFPLFLLPVWLSFYGRNGAGRCAGAFLLAVTLCGAGVGWLLWSDGAWPRSLHVAEALADWHPWREPRSGTFGLWSVVPGAWAYRLPVFIAYVAFVGATTFWPKPKNLGHLFALSAAVLLGVQFWYADQGGVHIFWYLPLVLLLVFRPNLSDRVAPTIQPESDWLRWLGRNAVRAAMWVLRLPDAPIQVG